MADKIKKMKVKQSDGTLSDYIYFAADASNVDMADGTDLQTTIDNVNTFLSKFTKRHLQEGDIIIPGTTLYIDMTNLDTTLSYASYNNS